MYPYKIDSTLNVRYQQQGVGGRGRPSLGPHVPCRIHHGLLSTIYQSCRRPALRVKAPTLSQSSSSWILLRLELHSKDLACLIRHVGLGGVLDHCHVHFHQRLYIPFLCSPLRSLRS